MAEEASGTDGRHRRSALLYGPVEDVTADPARLQVAARISDHYQGANVGRPSYAVPMRQAKEKRITRTAELVPFARRSSKVKSAIDLMSFTIAPQRRCGPSPTARQHDSSSNSDPDVLAVNQDDCHKPPVIRNGRAKSANRDTVGCCGAGHLLRRSIQYRLHKYNDMFYGSQKNSHYAEPTPILHDFLFIGNCISSIDQPRLAANRISNILNVAAGDMDERLAHFRPENAMNVKRVYLNDAEEADLLGHVADCVKFLDGVFARRQRVLVHCSHGQSRSPAIVIAYMIIRRCISLEDCLRHLISKRPCVSPNNGFLRQLMFLEARIERMSNASFQHGCGSCIQPQHLNGIENQYRASEFGRKTHDLIYLFSGGNVSQRDREYVDFLCSTT